MHRLAAWLVVLSFPMSAAAQDWHLARRDGGVDIAKLQPAARRAQRIALPESAAGTMPADAVRIDLFGRSLRAERTRFETRASGWLWVGRVDDSPGHFVQLTFHAGALAGLLSTAEGNYELIAQPDGDSVLAELDGTAFAPCGGAIEVLPVASPSEPAMAGRGLPDEPVDVMIAYTPPVLAALGSVAAVEAHAQAAVDASNTAFVNSAMTVRFRLVAVMPVARSDSGSIGADLTWLSGDPDVSARRDAVGADLVSLLVENGAGACGVGYVMRSPGPGFADSAFQVTARTCAVGNLSYAHEHGHNMGMEHDPANGTSPASASFPWSFGHVVDGSYRTVMSYSSVCTAGCPRRAYFSNPDVSYLGVPTGVAEERDNHRTGDLVHPIVAAFRMPPPDAIFASGFEP
ncbi:reprolysin-like metallopeptidase [Dokdonella koreensis]|nr:M12 family metallo-peptidase [Dokdonella koreensis]